MSNKTGFTLIEAVVAMLVGVILVVGMGKLGEGLLSRRASADFDSAAMSLAEGHFEALLGDSKPNPNSTQCAASPAPPLCGGAPPDGRAHGPIDVDSSGATNGGGPYRIQWSVVDLSTVAASPFVTANGVNIPVKKITVTVRHVQKSTTVNATLVRYFKAS